MTYVSFLNDEDGLGQLLAREPERYAGAMAIGQNIMTGPSELRVADRELIATYVSALNGCAFCYGTHAAIARAFGQDEKLIEAVIDDLDTPLLSEKLRPIMRYARKLTLEPARIIKADADAVFHAGWSEQVLSDVVAVTAYFAMFNRLADGHGLSGLTSERNESVAKYTLAHGYPSIEEMMRPVGK